MWSVLYRLDLLLTKLRCLPLTKRIRLPKLKIIKRHLQRMQKFRTSSQDRLLEIIFLCFFVLFCFLLFRPAPSAYGSSQARSWIRATAAGLCHSHSNTGSEPHLWPTPQLMAMPGLWPTEQGQRSNLQPHGCLSDSFPLSHSENSPEVFFSFLLFFINLPHSVNSETTMCCLFFTFYLFGFGFFFFFFFRPCGSSPDQGSNPCCSDNPGSLTCYATKELPIFYFKKKKS